MARYRGTNLFNVQYNSLYLRRFNNIGRKSVEHGVILEVKTEGAHLTYEFALQTPYTS